MKKLLSTGLLLAVVAAAAFVAMMILLSGCEKAHEVEPAPDPVVIGTWRIVPVGQPTDSFSYLIHSTLDSMSGVNVWYGGRVCDGPLEFEQHSGEQYSVVYLDTIGGNWHSFKSHTASATHPCYTDSLPATVY